jgi:hypothetical protein
LDDPSGIEKLGRATDFSLDSLGEAREEIGGVIRGLDETFCCIKFFAKHYGGILAPRGCDIGD